METKTKTTDSQDCFFSHHETEENKNKNKNMVDLEGSWLIICILVTFIIWAIYKSYIFIFVNVSKYSSGKIANETPLSLLEIKVTLPTRVIVGDEAILQKFDLSELAQLPKSRLGEGTLGTLYKVVLGGDCQSIITIRKIKDELSCSDDFEYWVKFFGGVRDSNLLSPLQFGFWYGGEAFIVHDYLCLGSLEELLHGSEGVQFTPLSWKIRLQIAVGTAKAVADIHSRVTKKGKNLVCGVIKSSNVLIQTDFSPCLSSYETAYLTSAATIIRRNPGRVAPELTQTRHFPKSFTQKSDVWSFGILLLELITGKRPSVTNLGEYVMEKRKREGIIGVPDKRMVDVYGNLSDMIRIAGICLMSNPKQRPSMEAVARMIEEVCSF